ncbi:hypothetical protein [Fulvivirga sediminis]|nr:hypothetical protein [Fulvivirga sediminis]
MKTVVTKSKETQKKEELISKLMQNNKDNFSSPCLIQCTVVGD